MLIEVSEGAEVGEGADRGGVRECLHGQRVVELRD